MAIGAEEDELSEISKIYEGDIDMDRLPCQLDLFKVMLQDYEILCFNDIHEIVKCFTAAQLDAIGEVSKIIHLILINPATSATGERSFSMARRIKTWLRSTMTPQRFNNLSILHEYKDRCRQLNLVDIANAFVSNENRHYRFGLFTKDDLS